MDVVGYLFPLLVAGAKLAADGLLTKIGEGAGEAIFEKLKARLTGEHKVTSLPMLEEARTDPTFEAPIRAHLANPSIATDAEVLALAQQLQAILEKAPTETLQRYAIDIREIRAGGNQVFDGVEGVKADVATAVRDQTFRNIKAPPPGR